MRAAWPSRSAISASVNENVMMWTSTWWATGQTDGVTDHRQYPIAQTVPADHAGEQSLHVVTPKRPAL